MTTYEIAWAGENSLALMASARAEYAKSNRVVATGGPLTYGLLPVDGNWMWSISVGSANYHRVRLDPAEIVRDADHKALSARWKRLGQRHAALRACVSLAECSAHEEVTSWFIEALSELDAKKILGSFCDGLDAKRAKSMSSGS